MTEKYKLFGQVLRVKRIKKGISLRKFAHLVGVSPTYVSQVEQGNMDPPTADRVAKMAEILGENPDEMISLAGRVPQDLRKILQNSPTQMPELLREASGLTSEQLKSVIDQARRMKEKEG